MSPRALFSLRLIELSAALSAIFFVWVWWGEADDRALQRDLMIHQLRSEAWRTLVMAQDNPRTVGLSEAFEVAARLGPLNSPDLQRARIFHVNIDYLNMANHRFDRIEIFNSTINRFYAPTSIGTIRFSDASIGTLWLSQFGNTLELEYFDCMASPTVECGVGRWNGREAHVSVIGSQIDELNIIRGTLISFACIDTEFNELKANGMRVEGLRFSGCSLPDANFTRVQVGQRRFASENGAIFIPFRRYEHLEVDGEFIRHETVILNDLSGANFSGATGFLQSDFDGACGNEATIPPEDITIQMCDTASSDRE